MAGQNDPFVLIFGNGPVETGLSLGTERYDRETHGARAAGTFSDVYRANLVEFNAIAGVPPRFARAIAAGAAVASTGRYGAIVDWKNSAAEWDPADNANAAVPAANREEFKQGIADALALVAASKVNWYKGNHHTGGRVATGFVARAYSVILDGTGSPPINEACTSLAWRLGHWFDTRIWLSSLGLQGYAVNNSFRIEVDDAVKKRIRSAPAGTAAFEAVYAGLEYIASHPVLCAANAPGLSNWTEWADAHAAIAANPARFHVGAYYLTGQNQVPVPNVPDPVIGFVATCIRYANRDATLLKAAVFKNVADDAATLTAIRAASAFKEVPREPKGISAWIAEASAAAAAAAAGPVGNAAVPAAQAGPAAPRVII